MADEGAYVSYLEGCTAPRRDENQLHAAVVEIIVEKDAEVKYSTVQNWYPGDREGRGGIYNFVTKRGICRENARLSWTPASPPSACRANRSSCTCTPRNTTAAARTSIRRSTPSSVRACTPRTAQETCHDPFTFHKYVFIY